MYFSLPSFWILNGVITWTLSSTCIPAILCNVCRLFIAPAFLKSNANTVAIRIVIQCGSALWIKWNPGLNCHIITFFGMAWSHFPRAHCLLSLAIIILGCITTGKSTTYVCSFLALKSWKKLLYWFHLQQGWCNFDPNACSAKISLKVSKNCQKYFA